MSSTLPTANQPAKDGVSEMVGGIRLYAGGGEAAPLSVGLCST